MTAPITAAVLEIDCEQVASEIVTALRRTVGRELHRRGAVVAVSGGVDSAVTAALCTRAFGSERAVALLMPERDSADDTLELSHEVVRATGMTAIHEDITPILEAARCYKRRNDAIRGLIPGFGDAWRWKIVLPKVTGSDAYRLFSVVAESPAGETVTARLPADAYLAVVAATNFKQRVRKMLEYYHADRLNFAVVGTPNRLEYDQGFFVKTGDGAADVKPIAHLYKTQVYRLAEHLGIPDVVCERIPTTDTYSLAQTQDEFYFSLPYEKMDLCLYAHNQRLPPESVADVVGLVPEDVARVFRDIDQKRRTTRYLHLPPLLLGPVPEVGGSVPAG